jgi:hypothetical protein
VEPHRQPPSQGNFQSLIIASSARSPPLLGNSSTAPRGTG